MTPLIPEFARDDVRGVFDGELVAFKEGYPHFPLVCSRLLHGRREILLRYHTQGEMGRGSFFRRAP